MSHHLPAAAHNDVVKDPKCQKCSLPYGLDRLMICMIACKHHVCQVCLWQQTKCVGPFCAICQTKTDSLEAPILNDMCEVMDTQRSEITKLKRKLDDQQSKEGCPEKKRRLTTDEMKCSDCNTVDIEQNLNICHSCSDPDSKNHEDLLKFAICFKCALRKHSQLGHTTFDFFPRVRDILFSARAQEMEAGIKDLDDVNAIRKAEIEKYQKMNYAVRKQITHMKVFTQNSSSTSALSHNMEKLLKYIEQSRSINADETSDVKTKTALLEKVLVELVDNVKRRRKSK